MADTLDKLGGRYDMDAVKYLKEFKRMCSSIGGDFCCKECPLSTGNDDDLGCRECSDEEKVAIVEKWSNENPIKTRQSEFLKIFPNAEMFEGVLCLDPCILEPNTVKCIEGDCNRCKREYWLEEIE